MQRPKNPEGFLLKWKDGCICVSERFFCFGMPESKSGGIETQGQRRIGTVFSVSDDRASDPGHLYANLMMASCIQCDLRDGKIILCTQKPVVEAGPLCTGRIRCAYAGCVGTGIFYKKMFQISFGRRGD